MSPSDRECADQAAVIAFLADPATHGADRVERIETHGAIVFLAGERAYKLKRAVHYPYMNFSTLERRAAACAAEVTLNRRTAPSIYLGAVPVVRRGSGLSLGGEGEIVDWVVEMRRFEQDSLLDRMAERDALAPDLVLALAEAVARFHCAAERAPANAPWGGAGGFAATLHETLDELAPPAAPSWFPEDRFAALREAALAELGRIGSLLDARKAAGLVRRCHGDLHLRNICLVDGRPTLFDAIEFNDALAWIDLLHDAAFLLMDLEHRGLRRHANLFLNRYLLLTGDLAGLRTLPAFLANRALVRAKVAAATARFASEAAALSRLRADAEAYFSAAESYLQPGAPVLVAVGGVSGTGKTRLAAHLAPLFGPAPGAIHLRTDVIRKRLFGVGETERLPESAYASEQHARVFGIMFEQARIALAAGHATILDGVFGQPHHRRTAATIAAEAGVPFVGLWLDAPEPALVRRVAERTGDASDATPAIVRAQLAADFGPIDWRRLDAGRPMAEVAAAARELVRAGATR